MAQTRRSGRGTSEEAPGSSFRIHLLGDLSVQADGDQERAIGSARARSLLGYLIVHDGLAQSRQRLAFLLWPDSTEAQARTNLRNVLARAAAGVPRAGGLRRSGHDDVAVARWRLVLGRSGRASFVARTRRRRGAWIGARGRGAPRGRRPVPRRPLGGLLRRVGGGGAGTSEGPLRGRVAEARRVVARPGGPGRGHAARAGGGEARSARRGRLPAAHARARRRR